MKRYIHDGVGLRVMRGSHVALDWWGDSTCDCGFLICSGAGPCAPVPIEVKLPPGWQPSIRGRYVHESGAEVQPRVGKWVWFPPDVETCPITEQRDTVEEAMLAAVPRWEMLRSYDGRPLYLNGPMAVFTDSKDLSWWQHNKSRETFYPSPEVAMLAAEKWWTDQAALLP